jgi:hypothetical protein
MALGQKVFPKTKISFENKTGCIPERLFGLIKLHEV